MGFNIQDYNLVSNREANGDWSNAVGFGCELIPFKKRREECEKARDSRKSTDSNVGADSALSKGAFCVKGTPIYSPGFYLLTNTNKRTQNRMICKARKEAKMKDDVVPANATKDNPATDSQAPVGDVVNPNAGASSGTPNTTGSNVGLYVGVGIGVLAILVTTVILIRRKK